MGIPTRGVEEWTFVGGKLNSYVRRLMTITWYTMETDLSEIVRISKTVLVVAYHTNMASG